MDIQTINELGKIFEGYDFGAMEPQVTPLKEWLEVENRCGETFFFPADQFCLDDVEDMGIDVRVHDYIMGYGARTSMPGYMDSTEWCVYDSPITAAYDLCDLYGVEKE